MCLHLYGHQYNCDYIMQNKTEIFKNEHNVFHIIYYYYTLTNNIYYIYLFVFVGDYAGFDEKEPTSKNGGKAEVIQMLKEKYGYTKLFMIGDGITDLEASPPADAFIGMFPNCCFVLLIQKN